MNNKKTWQRIIIFVLLAFAPYWIFAGLCDIMGIFNDETGLSFVCACAMGTPAIASLLTRLITREDMENSLLHIKGRNVPPKTAGKYYLLAILLPLIYTCIGTLILLAFSPDASPERVLNEAGVSHAGYVSIIFLNLAMGAAILPILLGEELGWRGYLFPKLKTVMPLPAAYITNGIIWGLWHTPAIIDGLNFGKGYPGYPFTGILLMCIFCIGTGIIFTRLTEKTGSVYPAALAHAVNNNAAYLISVLASSESSDVLTEFSAGLAGVYAVALVWIFWDRKSKVNS